MFLYARALHAMQANGLPAKPAAQPLRKAGKQVIMDDDDEDEGAHLHAAMDACMDAWHATSSSNTCRQLNTRTHVHACMALGDASHRCTRPLAEGVIIYLRHMLAG